MHGDIAALLDEAVLTGVDLTHADALRRRGTERHLADVARARAAGVRARLTAEGVNDVG